MPDTNQPRLLSFTLDDWAVLGGRVSVSLTDGVAVLVGRNGAGKSAILEGFEAISLRPIGRSPRTRPTDGDSIPKVLEIEVSTPNDRRLEYKYELKSLPISADDLDIDDSENSNLEESQFSWNEHCRYTDREKELLWTTEAGATTFNHGVWPITTFLGNTSFLRQSYPPENSPIMLPADEMQWVYAVLKGVRVLGKNQGRQMFRQRRPSLVRVSGRGVSPNLSGIADTLALKIFRRAETEELEELEGVCQRVGLGSKIVIQKFILTGESRDTTEGESKEYVASVLLDGVNVGLLSDGTLRVLSILIELIFSSPKFSMTAIIEEPETQIHPGMLAKLLNEIEAYTFGENLILSTHSPQVVAWTKPDKINLVDRNNGRTIIRKLGEGKMHNVVEYLCEEGNLGEWIYSGILDD
ncbi:MAG TPA: ATP-binding protein [Thermosynechococcaceae cyanobacterium]